jgi:hypothetical protein
VPLSPPIHHGAVTAHKAGEGPVVSGFDETAQDFRVAQALKLLMREQGPQIIGYDP